MAGSGRKKSGAAEGGLSEGVDVAPGVLDTIALLAAESVEGVAGISGSGLPQLTKGAPKSGVEVCAAEDGTYSVIVHMQVAYGKPIRTVASSVQEAVADALLSQTGIAATGVDVFVDGIVFPE
jgi:uncharacterized alkaline shock family protein YloU